jgi:RNA polymerase sigma-70 factor (ECF subfamily)
MGLADFQIQRKIQGGDIREFERLFMNYYEPLCRHSNKILNDMDAAEDIVQDFFYHFWKNRETFTLKLSLNAYFYHSIRINTLHYLQHLDIRRRYAEKVSREYKHLMEPQVQTAAEMNELERIIRETLQNMPVRCACIFRMNRFEGKKYREIAGILSVSLKTVEADMGKALQMMRESLKDYTGAGTDRLLDPEKATKAS